MFTATHNCWGMLLMEILQVLLAENFNSNTKSGARIVIIRINMTATNL